jgi:DNA-binding phage protein
MSTMKDRSDAAVSALARAAYDREYFRNVILQELLLALELSGATKAELARRLNKRPEQITRWLSAPGNLEIDTVSNLLSAMGVNPCTIIRSRPSAMASGLAGDLLSRLHVHPPISPAVASSAPAQPSLSLLSNRQLEASNALTVRQHGLLSAHLSEHRATNTTGTLSRRNAKAELEAA